MASPTSNKAATVTDEVEVAQEETGGYTVELLTQPPNNIQIECPICLLVLRDPFLVDCCGKNFCKTCIQTVLDTNQTCPTCKRVGFHTMVNKGQQQCLNELNVKCLSSKAGCKWVGELGQLDDHLNSNPKLEERGEGCEFTKVSCMFCSKPYDRCNVQTHEATKCQKRPFTCEYCKEYTSQYDDVIVTHLPQCGSIQATCPNTCGKSPLRQHMEKHIQTECPLTMTTCEFIHVGCQEKLPRKLMNVHLRENFMEHMSLQMTSLSQLNFQFKSENQMLREKLDKLEEKRTQLVDSFTQLQADNRKLEEGLKALHREKEFLNVRVSELQQSQEDLRGHVGLQNSAGFIEFTLSHFERHRKQCWSWFSQPFYTYYRGYKLCLRVDPNDMGNCNTSHVSLYLLLMRGEFDDDLKWPFKGDVRIELVDQTGSGEHRTAVFSMKGGRRVTVENRAIAGVSKLGFIAHDKLQPSYLKNDCLLFRVYQK